MNHPVPALQMSEGQRETLEQLMKSRTAPARVAQRAKVLVLAANGLANTQISARAGVAVSTVCAWRERFAQEGLAKFGEVRKGRGRRPSIPAEKVEAIVHATLHDTPPGETHWSCRTMAKAQGVSSATVQRV